MRQKFQLCFAFVVLLTLLLGPICAGESVHQVTFKWDDKKNVTLKCGSKHRLPNHRRVNLIRSQQLGYVIDFENLVKSDFGASSQPISNWRMMGKSI
jgi:hypothetical protein